MCTHIHVPSACVGQSSARGTAGSGGQSGQREHRRNDEVADAAAAAELLHEHAAVEVDAATRYVRRKLQTPNR